jgi:hypothetical protein
MRGVRLLLLVGLLAAPALAQSLTPPPEPAPEPPDRLATPDAAPPGQPAPPEAVAPPSAAGNPNRAGWAREGGALGFGLSAVPVGLAIASGVTQWTEKDAAGKYDLTTSHMLAVCAGLSAPLVALIPTFSGHSATVAPDLAHKPRGFRILGWILTGMATIDLVTVPLYSKAFGLVFGEGPSAFTAVTTVLGGLMASGGVVLLSLASRLSAERSAMQSEEVGPPATVFAPTVAPVFAWLPGPSGGSAMAGLAGSF